MKKLGILVASKQGHRIAVSLGAQTESERGAQLASFFFVSNNERMVIMVCGLALWLISCC